MKKLIGLLIMSFVLNANYASAQKLTEVTDGINVIIKGKEVHVGRPSTALAKTAGETNIITPEQANASPVAKGFETSFTPLDTTTVVEKVIKYSEHSSTDNFEKDAAYTNETINDSDFFVIKATASSQGKTTILYYKVGIELGYYLGAVGPAGGIIFNIKGNTYLESAPNDQRIGATPSQAVNSCDALTLGSYYDWFLPSASELKTLYVNRETVGNFAKDIYWSSSDRNPYGFTVWALNFANGNKEYYGSRDGGRSRPECDDENKDFHVRCIRSFTMKSLSKVLDKNVVVADEQTVSSESLGDYISELYVSSTNGCIVDYYLDNELVKKNIKLSDKLSKIPVDYEYHPIASVALLVKNTGEPSLCTVNIKVKELNKSLSMHAEAGQVISIKLK